VKTEIHYRREEPHRGYQVIEIGTGRLMAQFGSGPYEKYQAERFQVKIECPQVLRLADRIVAKYPELRKRALKAVMLHAEGRVHRNGAEHCFDVDSQSKEELSYKVDVRFGTCTCPDFEGALLGRRHSSPWCNGQPMCKHLVAAHMFEMLNQ